LNADRAPQLKASVSLTISSWLCNFDLEEFGA